ncbi:MAG: thioredoxin domain-containing protein [Bacteroides sp.]|nr:thioredoxin domain-containing protein [Bacteroides sp.]
MTLKHIILSLIIGISTAACAATPADNKTDATPAKADKAVVEYTGNTNITPDKKLPVVIDFSATWCGPCRRFAPIYEAVAKQYKGKAIFMSVDVDNSPNIARQFGARAIPQVSILLPDGTISSSVGFMEKAAFEDFLSKAIKSVSHNKS